jgi:hypothetical protein
MKRFYIESNNFLDELNEERLFTWVRTTDYCSIVEKARTSLVLILLIVIVEDMRSMILHSIWKVTRLVRLYLAAIYSIHMTSIIHGPQQHIVRYLSISYAPFHILS